MGGVTQALGIEKKPQAPQAPMPEEAAKKVETASRSEEEMAARMRGARSRGRQLLSDARLNPESGQTLGGGNSLGK